MAENQDAATEELTITDEQITLLSQHYTESELEALSIEEKLALVEDADPDALAALNGSEQKDNAASDDKGDQSKQDGDKGDDKDGDDKGDDEPDDKAGDDDKKGDEGKDGDDKQGDTPKAPRNDFAPVYHADPVEGYEEKLTALDKDFEEGDITLQEYNRQRDDLTRAQTKAEISAESSKQMEDQLWQRQQDDFFEDNEDYYKTDNDSLNAARYAALDVEVKRLGEANENRSGSWCLREAHKVVLDSLGGGAVNKDKDDDKAGDDKGDKKTKSRRPDLSDTPKTLSGAPAADSSETAGEFDYLDKLDGIAYEQALARLTDAKREQYFAT